MFCVDAHTNKLQINPFIFNWINEAHYYSRYVFTHNGPRFSFSQAVFKYLCNPNWTKIPTRFTKVSEIYIYCWMPVTCKWPDTEQLISFSDADNPKYKAKLTQLKCSLRYSCLCQEKWTLFISITPERSKSEAKLQKRWIRLKKVRGEKKMVLHENGGKIYIGCIQVMVDTKHIIQRNCCI